MGLAGLSARKFARRQWSRCAGIAVALLIAGCVPDDPGAGETGAEEPPRRLNVIEPTGQRSPYGNYLAGRYAERQRDFARAATALGRALDDFPDNLTLMRRTFFLSLEAGQMDTAVRLAGKLEESGAKLPVAQLLLAAESARKDDFADALRRLGAMKRGDLARYSVPLTLAWARIGAKQPADAVAALAPLDRESGFESLRQLHGALIQEFAGQGGPAEAAYRTSLGADPASAANRVIRAYGAFLERAGRAGEATALYDEYTGADMDGLLFEAARKRIAAGSKPDPLIDTATDGMAEGFFDIASVLPRESAGEIVLIYCRLALYLRPDFPLAQLLLAEVYEGFGRYGEAVEIYREINPAGAYGWVARLRLADDLYDMGDVKGAIAQLRRMVNDRPERSDALVRLGNILRYEGRNDESIKAYDQAVARLGEIQNDDWTILYGRGIALERSGRWDRAEQDFRKALELEPDQPTVLNYLGYSMVEKGINLAEARDMLERAVAQRQDSGFIVDSMGWALYKLGEFTDAVDYLERAVALRPQDPEINDHLGDAYWRVGRRSEARIQWRRVLGQEPGDKLRGEAENKLGKGLPAPEAVGAGG